MTTPFRLPVLAAWLAAGATMLALDFTWLGVVAKPAYDALGPLKAAQPNWLAAGLFYAFYVTAVVAFAIVPSARPRQAAWRGAGVGLVAYATYELTNWAVLSGWPALLVPIDIAWGVVLTAVVAAVGAAVHTRLAGGAGAE